MNIKYLILASALLAFEVNADSTLDAAIGGGLGGATGPVHDVAIPRIPIMVENDFLVEIFEFGHQPNTSRTEWRPLIRASISSTRLYRPKEALTVADR